MISAPLARRRETLRKVLRPGDEVVTVPAIAGEGRALHEAAAAQGIAGVMARQRSSPVPARDQEPALAVHPDARPGRRDAAGRRRGLKPEVPTAASAPVVALIRRLPLALRD